MKLFWVPFGLKPRPPEDETGPRYADMYVRGMAAGIDLLVLFLLLQDMFSFIARRVYAYIDPEKLARVHEATGMREMLAFLWQAQVPQLWLVNAAWQMLILGVLIVGCQSLWHTTPGKWLMGIKIVDAKTFETPSRLHFLLRFFAYIPAALPAMVGLLWVSFNKQRRGWHDYIAGTVVIHTRPRDWLWVQIKRAYRWLRERY